MVVRKFCVGDTLVRIHDDYFEDSPERMLDRVAQITSDAYRRTLMEQCGSKERNRDESA
jgi:hypothetical protein